MNEPADQTTPRCPWCSAPVAAGTEHCPACGAALVDETGGTEIPGLTEVDPQVVVEEAAAQKRMQRARTQSSNSMGVVVGGVLGGPLGALVGGAIQSALTDKSASAGGVGSGWASPSVAAAPRTRRWRSRSPAPMRAQATSAGDDSRFLRLA